MITFMDMRTILLTSGSITVLLALILLYVYFTSKTYPGFRSWVVSLLLAGLGFCLISARALLPNLLTIMLGNALIYTGLILIIRGLITFSGGKQRDGLDITFLAVFIFSFVYLSEIAPSVKWRIVTFTLMAVPYWLRGVVIAMTQMKKVLPRGNTLLGLALGLSGFQALVQGTLSALYEGPITDLMSASPIQGYSALFQVLTRIMVVVGLIIANSQRLELELAAARDQIKELKGYIPICANCKKIRDDAGYWQQIESYIQAHSEAVFSHGICPSCAVKLYGEDGLPKDET